MTYLDAAEAVLRVVGRPLRSDEITRIAIEKGYLPATGKTPEASMRAGFIMHINKGGTRFVRVSPGVYGLSESVATPTLMTRGRQRAKSSSGFVYILRDDHCKKCVKIGKTGGSLQKRLRTLQTGNPWIKEYVTLETSRYEDVERFLHNVIKLISRGKQVGTSEFYRFDPEDAKSILMEFERILPKDDFKLTVYDDAVSKARAGRKVVRDSEANKERLKAHQAGAVGAIWATKTQLAKLIAKRGGNEGAFGGILHFFNRRRPCPVTSKWRVPLESVGVKFNAKDFVVDWTCAKKRM